ncbi:MAG TPA: DNA-3-methyladenine glycosylase 2 family protein [Candidatus Paceibacterota bacterium]|nr:DNA-3-methyladenine glycosylase 2 family protein [Candidatus Paceibacterota bacterium]
MKGEHEEQALRHFKKSDPVLYRAAKRHKGTIISRIAPKRGADALFASLASSVVSQQLSTKAAATIWERLRTASGGAVTADTIALLKEEDMRAAGLSAAKVRTLKELSKAVKDGLDLPSLRKVPEEEAIASLTRVWGIGTWTAEMFLIFALGRLDVFSPGDLGVVRAIEELYGLEKDSHKNEYIAIAERWAPYRSVACLILWRHRDQP